MTLLFNIYFFQISELKSFGAKLPQKTPKISIFCSFSTFAQV